MSSPNRQSPIPVASQSSRSETPSATSVCESQPQQPQPPQPQQQQYHRHYHDQHPHHQQNNYHHGRRPLRVFSSSIRHQSSGESHQGGFLNKGSDGQPTTQGNKTQKKLGTLNGVFLPCIQNILGVILFLRLTNITGQAGTIHTSLIILASATSTTLTALSLSAIATNGEIQAGGPYYVISRTLGREWGASVGLLFYLGTSLATTMYVLGAIEALQRTVPWQFDARWASLLLLWGVASIVSVGIKYVNMVSNLLLAQLLLSIASMLLGCVLYALGRYQGLLSSSTDLVWMENSWPNYQPDPVTGVTPDFWSLLAIFYPSVTGILAGSNRSAMLHNPSKSIPNGTLAAIAFTTLIYLSVVWLFGCVLSNPVLIHDKFVVAAVAWPCDWFVALGVILSSVGASLQTMAGAPRVLAAIAMDDVLPFLQRLKPPGAVRVKEFGINHNLRNSTIGGHDEDVDENNQDEDQPVRAIWFTWFLASIPAFAGNLDHITPLVTVFFLTMYASINLSCFFLSFLKSPGFRPTFKYFHWSTCLLGFAWCLVLVALVSTWYTVLGVVVVMCVLHLYTKHHQHAALAQAEGGNGSGEQAWGDVGNALRYAVATTALRALSGTGRAEVNFHAKNWRPQVLTVVDTDHGRPINLHVLTLAKQLKQGGGGIHMVTSILQTQSALEHAETCRLLDHAKILLQSELRLRSMQDCTFAQVVPATPATARQALWSAVIHSGLGPLSPNSVLLNYPTSEQPLQMQRKEDFIVSLQGIMNMKKAVLLFKGKSDYATTDEFVLIPGAQRTIDVWWIVHDGGLLLLVPYLLKMSKYKGNALEGAQLRLFVVTSSPTENPDRLREAVVNHLSRVRIHASVHVVDLSDTSIADDMRNIEEQDGEPIVVPTDGENFSPSSSFKNDGDTISTLSASVVTSVSTHHVTVGEVFASQAYEVPYHAVLETDLEMNVPDAESDSISVVPDSCDVIDDNDDDNNGTAQPSDKGWEERHRTASAFNDALKRYSTRASLVVTNMPLIRPHFPACDFFDYVDAVSDTIDNILLVRGSGVEVVTTYV